MSFTQTSHTIWCDEPWKFNTLAHKKGTNPTLMPARKKEFRLWPSSGICYACFFLAAENFWRGILKKYSVPLPEQRENKLAAFYCALVFEDHQWFHEAAHGRKAEGRVHYRWQRGRSKYLLSVAKRRDEDDKTICELFYCLMDELEDITFSQSMQIILEALLDTVMEFFHITEA